MFDAGLLKNKRILITGGGTGLGRAMAERFLGLGAAVYICGRRADVLRQTCNELAQNGLKNIRGLSCDVRDAAVLFVRLGAIHAIAVLSLRSCSRFGPLQRSMFRHSVPLGQAAIVVSVARAPGRRLPKTGTQG